MVDFKSTWQYKGFIGFVNDRNETVKRYSVEDFELWVLESKSIPIPEAEFKPLTVHKEWFGKFKEWCLSEYIDDNFNSLTTEFYLSNNPTEHKANNTPQKTLRQIA